MRITNAELGHSHCVGDKEPVPEKSGEPCSSYTWSSLGNLYPMSIWPVDLVALGDG